MHGLPDALLYTFLGLLPFEERLRGPALVCKRWHRLCHSHDLTSEVSFSSTLTCSLSEECSAHKRVASLAAWLGKHASAVRSLRLGIESDWAERLARGDPLRSDKLRAQAAAAMEQVACCLQAAAGGGALCQLSVALPPAAWPTHPDLLRALPQMRCLRSLALQGYVWGKEAQLELPTALQRLDMTGPGVHNRDRKLAVRFPASLTCLRWSALPSEGGQLGGSGLRLLKEIGALPALRSLELHGAAGRLECPDWASLSRLTALQQLRVSNFYHLPTGLVAVLRGMAGLRLLELLDLRGEGDFGGADEAGRDLGTALGCLRQLSALLMHNIVSHNLFNLPPPAQLAELPQLQRLYYAVYAGGDSPGGLAEGPWQQRLRWLAVEERLLHESQAFLEGAMALECLHIKWYVYPDFRAPGGRNLAAAKWEWLWRWAEHSAALAVLSFDLGEGEPVQGWEAITARLAASRPQLVLQRRPFSTLHAELSGGRWGSEA